MKPQKISILLPIGLLVMSSSFFITRFTPIPDFVDGLLKGIGIGLLFLAIYRQRPKTTI